MPPLSCARHRFPPEHQGPSRAGLPAPVTKPHGGVIDLAEMAEIFARSRHRYAKALSYTVPSTAWSQGLAAAAQ